MDAIYNWIKNIVFFLVLITIINNLVESTSFKKYINLISGMILIILVVSPIFNIFDINEKIDYNYEKNAFTSDVQNIGNELIEIEEMQVSMILKEYKKEIENQTSKILEKKSLFISEFEVKINEDRKSDSFGEIEKLNLVASYIARKESSSSTPVEKVEIERIEIENDEYKHSNGNKDNEVVDSDNEEISLNSEIDLSDDEIYVKNLLSDFYNVNLDNINISIEE